MMRYLLGVAVLIGATRLAAQAPAPAAPFIGNWQGALALGGQKLRLGLTVARDGAGTITAVMTSIDQGNAELPASVSFSGDTLVLTMATAQARYAAVVAGDSLRGTFTQLGGSLPLTLGRVAARAALVRPQEPKPPYPYRTEDVTFESAPGVRLAGTISLPQGTGPFPAVVMVTGSGPQDRDEALMGHKPFLVLADYLARHGIASLRYDDRGIAKSTGKFTSATSADFADDAEAAVGFLRTHAGVAPSRVGVLGHSEGGMVAPIVATRNRDVAFIVLLAGPGVPTDSVLLVQNRLIAQASGASPAAIDIGERVNRRLYAAVKGARDSVDAAARLAAVRRDILAQTEESQRTMAAAQIDPAIAQLNSAWFRYFLQFDPRPLLRQVRVPVLALNGTLDLQVPYAVDLAGIDTALKAAGNRDYRVVDMPGLNHLFQHAKTGAPSEYGLIEETMSPDVLALIATWINERFGKK
jgi:fermentation-respiration switch protein FrsA (DUF1100 family)